MSSVPKQPTAIELFAGCAVKLARAEQQLEDLKARLIEFTDNCCVVEAKPKVQQGQLVFRVAEISEPPAVLAVMAGEILHNLRCPLNYLACALTVRNGQAITNRTEFPVCLDATEWSAAMVKNVPGLTAADLAFMELTQPHSKGDSHKNPLARLKFLNDADKHRVLATSYSVLDGHDFGTPHAFTVAKFTNRKPLKKGTNLLTIQLLEPVNPGHAQVHYSPRFDVVFRRQYPGDRFVTVTSMYRTLQGIRSYIHQHVFTQPGLADGFEWNPTLSKPLKSWTYWFYNRP